MFVRDQKPSKWKMIKEFIYPDMGYWRTLKYMYYRVVRLSDHTSKIAAGLAIGAAISFSPLMGTHFVQSLALAHIFRVNYLASMVGTFVGNPWTFPFLWVAGYELGVQILQLFGYDAQASLPDSDGLTLSAILHLLWEQPIDLFLPWMLGGYVCALICWPIAFCIFYIGVKSAKAARSKHFKRKAALVNKEKAS